MSATDPDGLVDNRYRILRRLGTGGMADVFLAQDTQLEREVALKLLHRRFAEDPGFVERFRREAQAAANLQHPNVVAVYDRGTWDGTYYIAMEYLQGRTLKQVIRTDAPLDPLRAIDICVQILKATRFAHRRGVIHRDLKPHNVMVDDQDHAKVTDFGIARAGASDMTETGSIMGTAQYLSPEQAQGLAVAEASDLYSIGVILFEMLTGQVPFDAESAVTIALKHVSEPPPPPRRLNPDIPPALEQTVLWALNKDPADRPQDADEFISILEGVREAVAAGGGAQPTASMTALGGGVLAGAAGAAAATGPFPRVALGERPLTEPATVVAPVTGQYAPLPPPPPPPYGDEERSGWSRAWPWLLALLVLALIAGGVVAFLLTRPVKVTVPIVVNDTQAVATSKLEADGLSPNPIQQASTERAGTVIYQSPLGGTRVNSGATIDLTVSSGPGSTTVPAVVDLSQTQAVAQLHLAGLKVSRVLTEPSSAVPSGKATRTDPAAGTDLQTGQGVVLYLSSGVAPVPVPSVTGDSLGTAQAALSNFHVQVTNQVSTSQAPGTVMSQTPAGGHNALPNSTVSLVVAQRPPTVTVPNVVGDSPTAAESAITSAGLTYVRTFQRTAVASLSNQVLSQSPVQSTKVKRGSSVTIVIGRYRPTNTQTNTTSNPSTTNTTTGPGPIPTGTGTGTTTGTGTSTTAQGTGTTPGSGL
ncbi:Stk1 family PASTA domain-containing Ser/Thr kinase [Conexibacter sp. DBS9H8]|uniref:Stk1 family PASTA domain-containing Ser/Thr kinase n=1 Tax=Conexibacter sp. DBS9H8 TaxID=2937801 RepID=UPI00200F19AE|nr:Stk1 family PASTA domain-containing Ser/Thr kinase [Conexibacter sp. DBS9H8]